MIMSKQGPSRSMLKCMLMIMLAIILKNYTNNIYKERLMKIIYEKDDLPRMVIASILVDLGIEERIIESISIDVKYDGSIEVDMVLKKDDTKIEVYLVNPRKVAEDTLIPTGLITMDGIDYPSADPSPQVVKASEE